MEKFSSPPSLEDMIAQGLEFLKKFLPDRMSFLNSHGNWQDGPIGIRDRAANEVFYRLWQQPEEERKLLFHSALFHLLRKEFWPPACKLHRLVQKQDKLEDNTMGILPSKKEINKAPSKKIESPFVIVFNALTWFLQYDTLMKGKDAVFPDWDKEGKLLKKETGERLGRQKELLKSLFPKNSMERLFSHLEEWKTSAPSVLADIPRLLYEEFRISQSLKLLLVKSKQDGYPEEAYGLILERLHPPQGIASQTHPALLYPCIQLLLDPDIQIDSGIAYQSAVILSILQDPRSTRALLGSLEKIPVHYTKIRENVIYTLGNLKEQKAVSLIGKVLSCPDKIVLESKNKKTPHLLLEQKAEALWALSKIGLSSLDELPLLVEQGKHDSEKIKTYLTWTLGKLGAVQKEHDGGVSADIVISLLTLLKSKSKEIFEEAVYALKKIDMPEFIHTLYLYNAGAVSILALKPAQKGLYELSETLHYLLEKKNRVVMAVNGDSGTGKTYFCQALLGGFGTLKSNEILYLMRDRKKDQKIFNRMLGLKWLKKYIDPSIYEDYPVPEEKDNPEEYFFKFLEDNKDKRLIILDGCRDRCYFQRIIDLFYFRGLLDTEVNFRATFSTRRQNLEERETALESIKTHLSFLEEPALEDTYYYQEGISFIYDLDNSFSSRLDKEETKELFNKRKIDSWGELIRIGEFGNEGTTIPVKKREISMEKNCFSLKKEKWPGSSKTTFRPKEKKFKPVLNENMKKNPFLLQTIQENSLKPVKIRFYAQEQIAGLGQEGSVFFLSFIDNRIFYVPLENQKDITSMGRDLFLTDGKGELTHISFESNEMSRFMDIPSPVTSSASYPRDRLVTGHEDGSVRIWDFREKETLAFSAHNFPVTSLAVDYQGRIYSSSPDRTISRWNPESGRCIHLFSPGEQTSRIRFFPFGKILALSLKDSGKKKKGETQALSLEIIDYERSFCHSISLPFSRTVSSMDVYSDGRIILTMTGGKKTYSPQEKNLVVISHSDTSSRYTLLPGHDHNSLDVLTMGPRIITCGSESPEEYSFRIWGTAFYIQTEAAKISILPSGM
ncbi:MAG: hypothetical protein JXB26_06945 [Candidatus Aminicenantes bacterium]|nr:hypothetical protein [Candidatus Aminicenantes bacterium]